MKATHILAAAAALSLGSLASAQVIFDFDAVTDNGDGTVTGSAFGAADGASGLSTSTAIDGTTALQATVGDDDNFANLISNFGSPDLFELGGTLTGDVVVSGLGSVGDVGGPQVFLARQGNVTGFDLTDSDDDDNGAGDNFNFTGEQVVGEVFSFDFSLPAITGTNDEFYGVTLGVQNIGVGGTVSFDNIVFSPNAIPEPASLALLSLGGLGLVRRRR